MPEPAPFAVSTANVDTEITATAGPQLVVPVLNARFALNASNARWGSLYDALYGTNAIPEDGGAETGASYNKVRGDKVIAWARDLPRHRRPPRVGIARRRRPLRRRRRRPDRQLADGTVTRLAEPEQVRRLPRRHGRPDAASCCATTDCTPRSRSTASSPIGSTDAAGVKDVVLESAVTTIMDFEDSVAAVDADDKVVGYRNWLGLNRGDLSEEIEQGRQVLHPPAQRDRMYTAADGSRAHACTVGRCCSSATSVT